MDLKRLCRNLINGMREKKLNCFSVRSFKSQRVRRPIGLIVYNKKVFVFQHDTLNDGQLQANEGE